MNWFGLLRDKLQLELFISADNALPFGVSGIEPNGWAGGDVKQVERDLFHLNARHECGLHGDYYIQFFADTCSVECWGELINMGSVPAPPIRELHTLQTKFLLSDTAGDPRVRWLNGVHWIPSHLPPYDYALQEASLVSTLHNHWLVLASAEDGRPTAQQLPFLVLSSADQTYGVTMWIEWAGLWRMALRRGMPQDVEDTASANLEMLARQNRLLEIRSGIWGLELALEPGQRLPLPRIMVGAYRGDLQTGSNAIRRHITTHVSPGLGGQPVVPPTFFNTWLAIKSDYTSKSLKPEVDAAAKVGLEYFTVDAAWNAGGFREGNGNWERPDPVKFPDGLKPFADYVNKAGLEFGLWYEPEWAHNTSDLFRRHPDWFLTTPVDHMFARRPMKGFFRPAYHLQDFGNPDVRAWWLSHLSQQYEKLNLRWIRWDANQIPRPNWDDNERSGQIGLSQIRFVEGLYAFFDELMQACPALHIEQCASGGNRLEPGILRRGHSYLCNDQSSNLDMVRFLQHGLNTFVPGNFCNLHVFQSSPDFSDLAMLSYGCGSMGYSGRLSVLTAVELEQFAKAINRFKEYREMLLGNYHCPTGQVKYPREQATVIFQCQQRRLVMEFNHPSLPGKARLTIHE